MISNWDFSLVLAISELLVDPQQPSSLLDIKLHAFQKAKDLMLQYEKRGIRRDLLDVILDKKLKLILKAETANEVKRASEPPKPVYNYGTWREDPFSVPEEELAMWAIISPNNMLSQPAQERYMDLFTATSHSLSRNRTNNWKEVSSHDRNNLFRPEEWHDVQPSQAEPRQRSPRACC